MKVMVNYEDSETLTIRLDNGFYGLAYNELEDAYDERGLKIGISRTVELTVREDEAQELCQRLFEVLMRGPNG